MSPAAAPAFNFILYKTSFKQTHSKNEHVFEHGFLNCEIKGDFFFRPHTQIRLHKPNSSCSFQIK